MDDVIENLFLLFCSIWRTVLKMFVRLFRIKASESLEKCLAGAMYKEENGETQTITALDYLRMPKLQAILVKTSVNIKKNVVKTSVPRSPAARVAIVFTTLRRHL